MLLFISVSGLLPPEYRKDQQTCNRFSRCGINRFSLKRARPRKSSVRMCDIAQRRTPAVGLPQPACKPCRLARFSCPSQRVAAKLPNCIMCLEWAIQAGHLPLLRFPPHTGSWVDWLARKTSSPRVAEICNVDNKRSRCSVAASPKSYIGLQAPNPKRQTSSC